MPFFPAQQQAFGPAQSFVQPQASNTPAINPRFMAQYQMMNMGYQDWTPEQDPGFNE